MGLRFRKSINLGGGVRLNLSRKGVGVSAGVKGFRVGVGPKGVRTTASIPGTGISYVEEKSFKSQRNNKYRSVNSNSLQNTNINTYVPEYLKAPEVKGTGWLGLSILLIPIAFLLPFILVVAIPAFAYGMYKTNQDDAKINTCLSRSINLYKKGKYDAFESEIKKLLDMDKNNYQGNILLGLLEFNRRDYDKVVQIWGVINHNTTLFDNELLLKYAYSLKTIGNTKEAIEIYQDLLRSNPEDLYLIETLGQCFYELEDYEAAVNIFEKAPLRKTSLDGELIHIRYYLGMCYLETGEKRKALTQLKRVYAQDINYANGKVAEIVENI